MRRAVLPLSKVLGVALLGGLGLSVQSARAVARVHPLPQTAASPQAAGLRTLGIVKSVSDTSIVISANDGSEVTANISPETRMLRVAPGQKDLSNATPFNLQDLQVGDRVLVRGLPQPDAKNVKAVSVIVMKQSDVSARHEQEQQDWQKRGIGGLVAAVDPGAGTITITIAGIGPNKKAIVVRTTKSTLLRRYALNSVKFDDAQPAPLEQIKVGDQLRARGTRTADGSELAAEEVVSGTFRSIAGTVATINPAAGTLTVQDAITKKPVAVKIASDSSVKKLPPEIAQRIAMRLRANAGNPGASGGGQGQPRAAGGSPAASGPAGERAGAPDVQRFLSRLADAKLTDLNKGDAVMIVSTEGGNSEAVIAITLLAGVEPILTAAPSGAASAILSPWTLGSGNAEAAAAP